MTTKEESDFFSTDIKGIAAEIAFNDARTKSQFISNFSTLFFNLKELHNLLEKNKIVIDDLLIREFSRWIIELKDIYKGILEAEKVPNNKEQVSLSQNLNNTLVNLYSKLFVENQINKIKYYEIYNLVLSKVNSLQVSELKDDFDSRIETKVESISKKVDTTQKKADAIISKLEERAGKKVVADYAEEYFDLSRTKFKESILWIALSALSVFSLILVLVFIYNESILNSSVEEFPDNIEFILLKIFILAVIVYVITFSVKQYNVCRNVSTIYREKAKALDSYKLLLASIDSEDKATRDQLTIELAKAIYQNLNSGYVSDVSGQRMNSGIYELTKNIVNQSSA